jgi:hypothetical protein
LPFQIAQSLEPWDLENLTDFDSKYLSGFLTETYQLEPQDGFKIAKDRMNQVILQSVKRDIGGDVQQVHSLETAYNDIKFKHILLPVWMNSYRYGGKIFHFVINARTGEVQGERPWSWIKIAAFAALIGLALYGFAVMSSTMQ